jgi:hypothetical protein
MLLHWFEVFSNSHTGCSVKLTKVYIFHSVMFLATSKLTDVKVWFFLTYDVYVQNLSLLKNSKHMKLYQFTFNSDDENDNKWISFS